MIHQPSNASQFYQTLKFAHRNFVQFYTPSVENCKRIDPFIESSCKERGVHLIRANTDKVPNIRNIYDIDIIPTFLVMDKDGNVIDRSQRAQKDEVSKLLSQCK